MSRKRARSRASQKMMERAVRRLGIIELLLLLLAAVAALLAGALTGWILRDALGWSFRWSWSVSSIVYFVVPGGIAWWRIRNEDRRRRARTSERDDGG